MQRTAAILVVALALVAWGLSARRPPPAPDLPRRDADGWVLVRVHPGEEADPPSAPPPPDEEAALRARIRQALLGGGAGS